MRQTLLTLSRRRNFLHILSLSVMDVTSLYNNIPQEKGINTVSQAYEDYHNKEPPITVRYLREMLSLILQENSFQFDGKDYLQIHGATMGTKMAVAFANVFMAKTEREILRLSYKKPLVWKRFIDDVFLLWNISRDEVNAFIEQANRLHPTIKFMAEISETGITFLDTYVYKGERFRNKSILDVRTHHKPTETFQYTNFHSCHPPGVKKKKRIYQRRSVQNSQNKFLREYIRSTYQKL